jgi:D-glycero-D-manno-heptose 1,7-bisphosphate phosphatase
MSPQRKKAEPGERQRLRPGAARRGVSAVFLDRDGTISEEVGYVNHLSRLQLYPWSAEAIRKLNRAGRRVIVVTNQSGVARGYFSEELVREVHEKMAQELAAHGAKVDAIYYCPHHPTGQLQAYRIDCRCRKPLTGMLEQAAWRFHIDLRSSYVVGDGYRDMQLGFNAGAHTILVLSGYGRGEYEHQRQRWPRQPDWIAENLLEAVDIILGEAARPAAGSRRSCLESHPL